MITSVVESLGKRVWLPVVVVVAVLSAIPAVDVWFSGFFFAPEHSLWVPRTTLMQFARSGMPPIIIGGLLFIVLLWVAGFVSKEIFWGVTGRRTAYLITTLIVGPGLIVESFLKTQSGRARPRDTQLFGGDDPFTPALSIGEACERNCSFVSGHAALAFWTTAFAFLLPREIRAPFLMAALIVGALMGLARIAEGAHFLSDVVYAGIIVTGLNAWLAMRMGIYQAPVRGGDGA